LDYHEEYRNLPFIAVPQIRIPSDIKTPLSESEKSR